MFTSRLFWKLLTTCSGIGVAAIILLAITTVQQREDHLVAEFDEHLERVFSRSELMDLAFGSDSLVLERTIDVHIRSLRKKIDEHACLLETVRGVGYRFRDPASQG
jgi:two-component system phosphate regulon response regulator PhoB